MNRINWNNQPERSRRPGRGPNPTVTCFTPTTRCMLLWAWWEHTEDEGDFVIHDSGEVLGIAVVQVGAETMPNPVILSADGGLTTLEHLAAAANDLAVFRTVLCPWAREEDRDRLAGIQSEMELEAEERFNEQEAFRSN